MTLYAVIDTNVLVSAFLKENSIPRYVINTMYAGNIIPIYNAEIIAEYTAVLHRPKFCFPPAAVDIVVNEIQEIGLKFDGISVKEPMLPNGKTTEKKRSYAFRSIWEETTPTVNGYSSLWRIPKITDVYQ